jgi:hypothetical protein
MHTNNDMAKSDVQLQVVDPEMSAGTQASNS